MTQTPEAVGIPTRPRRLRLIFCLVGMVGTVDIQALIAKAKAKAAEQTAQIATVEVGGELVDVTLIKVDGSTWTNVTAMCPGRPGSMRDVNIGYNADNVPRVYPIDHIKVDGDEVDEETWLGILDVLEAPSLKLITASLWGMHEHQPDELVRELGKARTAATSKKRPSHASSESPRVD